MICIIFQTIDDVLIHLFNINNNLHTGPLGQDFIQPRGTTSVSVLLSRRPELFRAHTTSPVHASK